MLTLKRISKEIFSDLSRGFRLLVIIVPISAAAVCAIAFANPAASGDEIATTAVVPLLVSYLMVRGIMWLASGAAQPSQEEMRAFEEERLRRSPQFSIEIPALFVFVFLLGMWWIVAGGLSAGAYWALGLTSAFSTTVSSLKWACSIVALDAVLICLITLCGIWLLKIAKFFHDAFDDPFSFFHGRA